MERLLELNRNRLFEAALMAAELARELGRWEDVPKYLDLPFPQEIAEVARRIASLTEARDSRVARVR